MTPLLHGPCTRHSHNMDNHHLLFPRHTEKLASWSFNGVFGRNFARLINLQMWCFGCDIRRPEGNLLIEYGFTRERPCETTCGSSRYAKDTKSGMSLSIWGFGLLLTDESSALYLRRFTRVPKVLFGRFDTTRIHKPHAMSKFREPTTRSEIEQGRRLLYALREELVCYEHYVAHRASDLFTTRRLVTAPKGSDYLRGWELKDAWLSL